MFCNWGLDESEVMRMFNMPRSTADILSYANLLNKLLERYQWPLRLRIDQDYSYLYRVWCVGRDGKDMIDLSQRTNPPLGKENLWGWMNGFYSAIEFLEATKKGKG